MPKDHPVELPAHQHEVVGSCEGLIDSPVRCKSEGVIQRVELRTLARKQLRRMPRHIVENLAAWVDDVETRGLEAVRKVPGYHDEPLHGDRQGQRAIRLSRAYRAMYVVKEDEAGTFVSIEEVSKHDY
jgi:proteic killer suppression protein